MGLLQKILTSVTFQKMVNQKKLSAFMGWLASGHLPSFLLKPTINFFIKSNNIDLSQYDFDLANVQTFNEFFTRKLKPGHRHFEGLISSGADGFVSAFGKMHQNKLIQVKGRYFTLAELIDDNVVFENGSFTTVYLSPADYHRVHLPFDARITAMKKIAGRLFSVSKDTVERVDKVYVQNERVVFEGEWQHGKFYLVMVGAIVVGRIKLSFTDIQLDFNKWQTVDFQLKQGDELGLFELGSTIILAVETNHLEEIPYSLHQKIYMGNRLN